MNAAAWSPNSITPLVRWLARGLSVLAAGMVALFFIGEGGFNRADWSPSGVIQLALFFTAWLGLLVAWRYELLGAAMTLGGMLLFYLMNYLAVGRWPGGWAFAFIASPGLLFLYCGLREWWVHRPLAPSSSGAG